MYNPKHYNILSQFILLPPNRKPFSGLSIEALDSVNVSFSFEDAAKYNDER